MIIFNNLFVDVQDQCFIKENKIQRNSSLRINAPPPSLILTRTKQYGNESKCPHKNWVIFFETFLTLSYNFTQGKSLFNNSNAENLNFKCTRNNCLFSRLLSKT